MDIDTYRAEVRRTTTDQPLKEQLVLGAMGVVGEAGELVELVKKIVYHSHDVSRERIREEAGDLLWYTTFLLNALDVPTEAIDVPVQHASMSPDHVY
ncbi:MAG: MazG nucleotide pyrophosphohydrolase domain-containing protein, partial [Ktedonobacterales bacterium]